MEVIIILSTVRTSYLSEWVVASVMYGFTEDL